MSAGPSSLAYPPQPEGWARHWLALQRFADVRVAASVSIALLLAIGTVLCRCEQRAEQFFFDEKLTVSGRNLHGMNSVGDYALQDYLAAQRQPGVKDCVVLGASYTATSVEPDPTLRLGARVQAELARRSGEDWRCTNLATDGAVVWAYFYCARLLRLHHPPDALVVALDTAYPRSGNLHFLLNVGARPGEFTARELAYTVPCNQVLQYIGEADFKKWLRGWLPLLRASDYLAAARPYRRDFIPWLKFVGNEITGRQAPIGYRSPRLGADGRPLNWHLSTEQRQEFEVFQREGVKQPGDARVPRDIDLLFAELARCQSAGIKVIVVSMPRNPVLRHDLDTLKSSALASAARHGLVFHDYWLSGLIPEQYFVDHGHFFGAGCAIMGAELARLIVNSPGSGGVTPPDKGANQ